MLHCAGTFFTVAAALAYPGPLLGYHRVQPEIGTLDLLLIRVLMLPCLGAVNVNLKLTSNQWRTTEEAAPVTVKWSNDMCAEFRPALGRKTTQGNQPNYGLDTHLQQRSPPPPSKTCPVLQIKRTWSPLVLDGDWLLYFESNRTGSIPISGSRSRVALAVQYNHNRGVSVRLSICF